MVPALRPGRHRARRGIGQLRDFPGQHVADAEQLDRLFQRRLSVGGAADAIA